MDKETLRAELKSFTDTLINGYTGDSTILELLGTSDCINDYVDNQLRERWQKPDASENTLPIDSVTNSALILKVQKLEADNKLLQFMVDNGINEEEMFNSNDITMPQEI